MIRTYMFYVLCLVVPCNASAMTTDFQDPSQRLTNSIMANDVEGVNRALAMEGEIFNLEKVLEFATLVGSTDVAVELIRRKFPLNKKIIFTSVTRFSMAYRGSRCEAYVLGLSERDDFGIPEIPDPYLSEESMEMCQSYSRVISALIERIEEGSCAPESITVEDILEKAKDTDCEDKIQKILKDLVPDMLRRRTRGAKYSRKSIGNERSGNILHLLRMRQLNGSNPRV